MKPLIVAWLEQVDELVGDNHVEAFDGIGGKFACDANGKDQVVGSYACKDPEEDGPYRMDRYERPSLRVFILRTETRETAIPIAISYACTISRSAVVTSDA